MKTIQEQLRQWADKTADAYHKLAIDPNHPECNLAFYTQSDLTKIDGCPELLIIGINPADHDKTQYTYSGDDGKGQIENENWGIPDGMNGEKLLQGNPHNHDRQKWPIWKNLVSVFRYGSIEKTLQHKNLAYTNLIFFATADVSKIPIKAYDLEFCVYELIEILRPKKILCLGRPCKEKMQKQVPFRELISNELYIGKLQDSVVYAMPHPSKPNWSNEEKDMIGSCLGYLFNMENSDSVTPESIRDKFSDKIEAWRNRQSTPTYKVDFEELSRKIEERFGEPFKKDPKTSRYDFTKDTALTVTKTGDGYVGIRAKRGAGKDWNSGLENRDKYTWILLDGYKWKTESQWLGIKRLKHIESIEKFIEELSAINKQFDQVG